ncbi:hypothetical protein AB0P21_20415 [Kribbella sp. NPDC056861]|uniref:hypothetical protein n=1 Tax=Kribbella sp. NPDC056861 TaxID=3154857 RepID=UPI00343DC837
MNTPPEHDLRPSTRERQRDELIAIVGHESHQGAPRRRIVSLVAAAAVLALTTGLAVGIPVLRDERRGLPVNGPVKKQTDVEPLDAADKARFGKACADKMQFPIPARAGRSEPFEVLDGFSFPHAKSNTYTPVWVVVHTKMMGWISCGIDSTGKVRQAYPSGENQVMYRPVENRMIGGGAYAKSITRITITVGTRPAMEVVLRHGYFYAPVPYVRVRGPHSASTAIPVVVRGYDATGKLVYTSPRTDGEFHARRNACYIDPNGKLVAWMSDNPSPDPKTCKKSSVWNYLRPR